MKNKRLKRKTNADYVKEWEAWNKRFGYLWERRRIATEKDWVDFKKQLKVKK